MEELSAENPAAHFLEQIKPFKNLVVSGPQRSGTTFLGYALGKTLDCAYHKEEAIDNDDFEKLKMLLETAGQKVVQCPGLCHRLDEIDRRDTLVLFLRRDLAEIHRSEVRINWNRPRHKRGQYMTEAEYEKTKYLAKISDAAKSGLPLVDFSKSIAEIKYAFWDAWQKGRTRHLEVSYPELKDLFPALWLDQEERKNFGARQVEKNTEGYTAKLYADTGSGYSEQETVERYIDEDTSQLEFDLSAFPHLRELRFDPASLPVHLSLERAFVRQGGGKTAGCEILGSNALAKEGSSYLFDTSDPNIYIGLPARTQAESFVVELTYRAFGSAVVPLLAAHFKKSAGSAEKEAELAGLLAAKEEALRQLAASLDEARQSSSTDLARRDESLETLKAALAGRDETLKSLEASLAGKDEASKSLEAALAGKNELLETLRSALAGKDELLETLRSALAGKDEDARAREEKAGLLLHTLQSSLQTIEALRLSLAQKDEILLMQNQKIARRGRRLKSLRQAIESLEQAGEAASRQLALALAEKTTAGQAAQLAQASLAELKTTGARQEERAGQLSQQVASLESVLHENEIRFFHLRSDRQAKEKYIGELRHSLSFRLGWALTAPLRWLWENLRVAFWSKFLSAAWSSPGSFFKNTSLEKIRILRKALRTEPPSLILRNFAKLLAGANTSLPVAKRVSAEISPLPSPPQEALPEAEPDSRKIHFYIDHFEEMDFHFFIKGWLFPEKGKLQSLCVQTEQDGKTARSAPFYHIDRWDVFQHFGNKNAIASGFSEEVEKVFAGKVHLSFVAELEDGAEARLDIGESTFGEPFPAAVKDAMSANRAAFLAAQGSRKKAGSRSVALYTSSKGNYFFNEIKALVARGFESCGFLAHDLNEADGFDNDALLHVVIAPHEFFVMGGKQAADPGKKPSDRLVLLNTEQPASVWFGKGSPWFRHALEVWDMNHESWKRLSSSIDFARFLPLGFAADLGLLGEVGQLPENYFTSFLEERTRKESFLHRSFEERPIDILFVGHASPRRQHFFAKNAAFFSKYNCYFHLTDLNHGPHTASKTTMNTRTAIGLAQRAKIILNIHHGRRSYFEWHRVVMHGIWQRGLVLSELCSEAPPFQPGRDFVQVPLDGLAEKIGHYLDTAQGRQEASEIIHHAWTTLTTQCGIEATVRELAEPLLGKG